MARPARPGAVAVVGNGLIGHGVAQVFAAAGMPVRLIGRRQASLDAALGRIRESLERFRIHRLLTGAEAAAAVARVSTATDLDAAAGADLVVEAVTEDLPLKHGVFERLDRACPPPAAMADLVREGHRGLGSGRGLHDWSTRDGRALLARRVEELFRHLGSARPA